jgi:hypothetical protein
MVALTRGFDVFPSRVTANFTAVFFSVGYVAKTWYMWRTSWSLDSPLQYSVPSSSDPPALITKALRL